MRARPVVEVRDRFDVVRPAFARSPHAYDFDSHLRRLSQSPGHARAIVIAVHHGHIRANESKWFSVEDESRSLCLHKSGTARRKTAVSKMPSQEPSHNLPSRTHTQPAESH